LRSAANEPKRALINACNATGFSSTATSHFAHSRRSFALAFRMLTGARTGTRLRPQAGRHIRADAAKPERPHGVDQPRLGAGIHVLDGDVGDLELRRTAASNSLLRRRSPNRRRRATVDVGKAGTRVNG
jgi:hypothetical protein